MGFNCSWQYLIISLKKYGLDRENKTKDIIFEIYLLYTNCKNLSIVGYFLPGWRWKILTLIVITWKGLNFQSVSMLLFQVRLIGEPATDREIPWEVGLTCSQNSCDICRNLVLARKLPGCQSIFQRQDIIFTACCIAYREPSSAIIGFLRWKRGHRIQPLTQHCQIHY